MSNVVNTTIDQLEVGQTITGEVKNIVEYGAFVNIGLDKDALMHISNLSEAFVNDVNDIVSVGDEVEVEIIDIDADKARIGLKLTNNLSR